MSLQHASFDFIAEHFIHR